MVGVWVVEVFGGEVWVVKFFLVIDFVVEEVLELFWSVVIVGLMVFYMLVEGLVGFFFFYGWFEGVEGNGIGYIYVDNGNWFMLFVLGFWIGGYCDGLVLIMNIVLVV